MSETTSARPSLVRRPASSAANVWAVLRRELGARLLTGGYVWSTLIFAAMALLSPLLIPTPTDAEAPSIAIVTEAEHLLPALDAAGIDTVTTPSRDAAETLLADEAVDAVLLPDGDSGWVLLGESGVSDALVSTVQTLLTLDALQTLAIDAGVTPDALRDGTSNTVVTAEVLDAGGDSKWNVFIALGFGLVIVFVIVLWGATMATDVVQEKATRVVEILIATIRPWQLLAGKVAALTTTGLIQITVVLAAALTGMQLFAGGLDLTALSTPVVITGLVSILIGVPLLAALMAAMAARVEHQDDLGTATQPVYLLLMAPFAAAVYVSLNAPTGVAMQILSLAPLTNIFAMPARVAAMPVPVWEIALAFIVALATLATVIWLGGRIYAGSILRAGSTVTLRDAFSKQ